MSDSLSDVLGDAAAHIDVQMAGGVATVAFTRPEKHNAISYAMWGGLGRLMPVLGADEDVDVVLLRGTPGGPFSAGADIGEFRTLRADAQGARRYGEAIDAGERAIIHCRKPTIAAIEGFAIGGGTQIAVACDLRVCGEGSRFGVTPAKLGIVYALASTERLVETVGAAWARWILLTGELIDAATAVRIGLVHEVVPDVEVLDRAHRLARTLASRSRASLVGGKVMIDRVAHAQLDEDDDVHALYEQPFLNGEYAEGVAAFLDKRDANFRTARTARRAP